MYIIYIIRSRSAHYVVRPGPGGQGTFSVLCDNFHIEIEMPIGPKLLSRY